MEKEPGRGFGKRVKEPRVPGRAQLAPAPNLREIKKPGGGRGLTLS